MKSSFTRHPTEAEMQAAVTIGANTWAADVLMGPEGKDEGYFIIARTSIAWYPTYESAVEASRHYNHLVGQHRYYPERA